MARTIRLPIVVVAALIVGAALHAQGTAGDPRDAEIAQLRAQVAALTQALTTCQGSGTATVSPTAMPLDKVMASIADLQTITKIGVLRDQYSAKLIEKLPPVQTFVDSSHGEWFDVSLGLLEILNDYKGPMASLDDWSYAWKYWAEADRRSAYIKRIVIFADERTHHEQTGSRTIDIGQKLSGRLGFGDALMKSDIDEDGANGFADKFSITLTSKTRLELIMNSTDCPVRLYVMSTAGPFAGSVLDNDHDDSQAVIKKTLAPGTYTISAGTLPTWIGAYTLTASTY